MLSQDTVDRKWDGRAGVGTLGLVRSQGPSWGRFLREITTKIIMIIAASATDHLTCAIQPFEVGIYPHFADEEVKDQQDYSDTPRSFSW